MEPSGQLRAFSGGLEVVVAVGGYSIRKQPQKGTKFTAAFCSYLLLRASEQDSGAKGINGNQANQSWMDSGAVYVFTRN